MILPNLNWWMKSDAGLLARVSIGVAIFATFAVVDLIRHGSKATRWREYLFLAAAAVAAMMYGVLNDRVASSISWEYFYFGKGLGPQLGPHIPPEPAALHWEACKIGLKATWSVGLLIGVALLIANNPRKNRRQLPYRALLMLLPMVLIATALFAIICGWIGSRGWLAWTSQDLVLIARDNMFRPYRFMCVYGMNLGAYGGGSLATIVAMAYIAQRRKAKYGSTKGH